jgi:hypothetical protein
MHKQSCYQQRLVDHKALLILEIVFNTNRTLLKLFTINQRRELGKYIPLLTKFYLPPTKQGIHIPNVGIKYIEQRTGLDLDHDDCLVSTVFDLMISGQDTNRRLVPLPVMRSKCS